MAAKKIPGAVEAMERRAKGRKAARDAQARDEQGTSDRSYGDTVAALTAAGAAPAPTETTLTASALDTGEAILRIPAGGTATLRVTEMGGWHYDTATLRFEPYGRNMALPLVLERNTPGPSGFEAARTLAPSPPLFIGALVYGYTAYRKGASDVISADVLELEVEGSAKSLAMGLNTYHTKIPTWEAYIGGAVSKLTLTQKTAHTRTPRVTAILPNSAEGLSVAQEDDRVLHSVPRRLGSGDSAESRDLSGYFNTQSTSGEDTAVLRIGARTDCCVKLTLDITRRRVTEGTLGAPLADPLELSPWQARVLTPALPDGTGVTTTLTARAKPSGPARLGLRTATPLAACQGVMLPPRVSYLQPFRLPDSGQSPRRLAGVWLGLSAPPREAETLFADVAAFDSETLEPGEVRASGKAEISTRQMDLVDIGGGMFAHWMAFDQPLDIDTPELTHTFALILRDLSGPVPLLEAPATGNPALSPALFRNFGRSDRWTQRQFGQAAKVLMFEIGETKDTAVVTLEAGAVRTSVTVPERGAEISLEVPGALSLMLSADREIVLDAPHLLSRSAPGG